MEQIASIVGGFCLIASGVWLSGLKAPIWQSDEDDGSPAYQSIRRWSSVQRVIRGLNNWLMIGIGVCIVATGFVPHGAVWMVLWGAVLLALLVCVLLALADAFTSITGYRKAIPQAARRSLGDEAKLLAKNNDCK